MLRRIQILAILVALVLTGTSTSRAGDRFQRFMRFMGYGFGDGWHVENRCHRYCGAPAPVPAAREPRYQVPEPVPALQSPSDQSMWPPRLAR